MANVDVRTPLGATGSGSARSIELPDEIFDVQVNVPLIHQVVVAQLAAARQGTHDTKTRGEVRGGGRKPYRQKGTGRARQGSTRAPQFAGGGTVHGPKPRDYAQRTPKKMKAAALRGALSDRARGGRVHVVAGLVEGDTPSTKSAWATLASVVSSKHVLLVAEREDVVTWKSLRNVPTVHVLAPDQLNTYDVLVSDDVVFTEGALNAFLDPRKGAAVSSGPDKPEAGTTKPAGEGVSDTEMADEVAAQTSPDLKAEAAFEKAADKDTDEPAETALADEVDDSELGGEG